MVAPEGGARADDDEFAVCVSVWVAERVELGAGEGGVDGGVAEEGAAEVWGEEGDDRLSKAGRGMRQRESAEAEDGERGDRADAVRCEIGVDEGERVGAPCRGRFWAFGRGLGFGRWSLWWRIVNETERERRGVVAVDRERGGEVSARATEVLGVSELLASGWPLVRMGGGR